MSSSGFTALPAPTYQCPTVNGQNVTDQYSNVYAIGCGLDTKLGSYAQGSASTSWDDCFTACANGTSGGRSCGSFTYVGGVNGTGYGICYLKSPSYTGTNDSFINGANNDVAAIMLRYYNFAGNTNGTSSGSGTAGTGTGTASGSGSATVSTPTFTPSTQAYACPGNNGTQVTDTYGYIYNIYCGSDTGGGSGLSQYTVNSFDDCFGYCDTASGCTGFTYSGAVNGAGYGTCFLKGGFMYFTGGNNVNLVSAIQPAHQVNAPAPASTSSVATSSSSAGTAPTMFASCPAANGTTVTDNGSSQYQVMCSSDTGNGNYQVVNVAYSWNDCFAQCDASTSPRCTSFTYAGGTNGVGSGQCFLKAGTTDYFVPSNNIHVAAIRAGDVVASPPPTSTASQAPAATTDVCQNNTVVTDSNSVQYTLYCSYDTTGGTQLNSTTFTGGDFTQCETGCDSIGSTCYGWTWSSYGPGAGGICYYKGTGVTVTPGGSVLTSGLRGAQPGASQGSGMIGQTASGSAATTSSTVGTTSSVPATSSSAATTSSSAATTSSSVATTSSSLATTSSSLATTTSSSPATTSSSPATTSSSPATTSSSPATTSSSLAATSSSIATTSSNAVTTSSAAPGTTSSSSAGTTSSSAATTSSSTATGSSSSISSTGTTASSTASVAPTTSSASGSGSSTSRSASASSAAGPGTSSGATTSSSLSTMSSSTSSSAPASTSCTTNGTVTDANGVTYNIYCNVDTSGSGGGAFSNQIFSNGPYTVCNAGCDSTAGCGAWTWVPYPPPSTGGVCYYKQLPQAPVAGNSGGVAGIRVTTGASTSSSSTSTASQSTASQSTASQSTASQSTASQSTASQSTASQSTASQSTASAPASSSTASQSVGTSTSSIASTSSSSPSASASCTPGPVTDANGIVYTIYCSSDTSGSGGGTISSQIFGSGSYLQCNAACDNSTGCGAWTWVPYTTGGGVCYFKKLPQSPAAGNTGGVAGIQGSPGSTSSSSSVIMSPTSSSTPTSNSIAVSTTSATGQSTTSAPSQSTSSAVSMTSTTSSASSSSAPAACQGGTSTDPATGRVYQIYCNDDTSGSGAYNTITYPTGGYMQCFSACANDTTCTAFVFAPGATTGGACFLKSGAQTPIAGSSGFVAGIAVVSTSSSTAAASSSSSLSSVLGSSRASSNAAASGSTTSLVSSTSSMAAAGSTSAMSSLGVMTTTSGSVLVATSGSSLTSSSVSMSSSTSLPTPTASTSSSFVSTAIGATSGLVSNSSASTALSSLSAFQTSSIISISSISSAVTSNSPGVALSSSTPLSISASTTSTTSLPACGSAVATASAGANSTCSDPYGNTYNVTTGTRYTGTVSVRQKNVGTLQNCLTNCDTTPGCQAANYNSTSQECDLLSAVNGTEPVTGPGAADVQAAQRPPDVSTVYTAPPTSTFSSSSMPSNSSIGVITGGPGPVQSPTLSGVTSASAANSMSMGTSSTATLTGSGLSNSGLTPTPSSSMGSMSMSTMSAGSGSAGSMSSMTGSSSLTSSMAGSQSGSGGPPTIIVSPLPGTSSSLTATGGSYAGNGSSAGSMTSQTSSSTATSLPTVSTGNPCPGYNNTQYTDSSYATYSVSCSRSYSGTALRMVLGGISQQQCLAQCDADVSCQAITYTTTNCTLWTNVSGGLVYSSGASSALKVVGPPGTGTGGNGGSSAGTGGSATGSGSGSGTGSVNVVTVTVCAASRTTTVFTTATLTTCPVAGCSATGMAAMPTMAGMS